MCSFGCPAELLAMMSKTAAPQARLPLTEAGMTSYVGVLAAYEIVIAGTLPEGKTTTNVMYFIVDTATITIVGTAPLPDAVERKTSVSLTLKVPKPQRFACDRYLQRRDFSRVEFSERTQSHE